jgi:hypothetical protein
MKNERTTPSATRYRNEATDAQGCARTNERRIVDLGGPVLGVLRLDLSRPGNSGTVDALPYDPTRVKDGSAGPVSAPGTRDGIAGTGGAG